MRRASQAERARLGETFAALCAIESPFGHERAVADWVVAELAALGLDVEEDEAGALTGGDCGNLLARIPAATPGTRTILLCAHLDTVEVTAPVVPVLVDEGWESANPGILGADNKAAVAVMLEGIRRVVAEGSPVGIELLLTVSEENALAGAKVFDPGRLDADFGYVFDHATPIGEVVLASPTYHRLEAEVLGRAVHAGIRPEDGRSAIVAAAHAVAAMPHGRIDEQTTANVGSIHGGVGSTNVVAERCRLLAEARSLDPERAERVIGEMVDALAEAASHAGCDVDLSAERLFEGFKLKPSHPAVVAAEQALRATGYEPKRIVTGGGSDANALAVSGLTCVNLANGTERNHEPTERVSVAALDGMLDVTLALLDAAAEARPPG